MHARQLIQPAVFAVFTALGALPAIAQASEPYEPETRLGSPQPEPVPYTQPLCSACRKVKVRRQTTATGETRWILEIDYYNEVLDEELDEFDGEIVVTAQMATDGNQYEILLEDVWLAWGDEASWDLGTSTLWDWLDVEIAWVELVPAQ